MCRSGFDPGSGSSEVDQAAPVVEGSMQRVGCFLDMLVVENVVVVVVVVGGGWPEVLPVGCLVQPRSG